MQYAPLSEDSPNNSDDGTGSLTASSASSSINASLLSGSNVIKKITPSKKSKSSQLSEPLTALDDLTLYENDVNFSKPEFDIEMDGDRNEGKNLSSYSQENDPIVDNDPFYLFKDDLLRKLTFSEQGLKSYLHTVHDTVRNSV